MDIINHTLSIDDSWNQSELIRLKPVCKQGADSGILDRGVHCKRWNFMAKLEELERGKISKIYDSNAMCLSIS